MGSAAVAYEVGRFSDPLGVHNRVLLTIISSGSPNAPPSLTDSALAGSTGAAARSDPYEKRAVRPLLMAVKAADSLPNPA